MNQIPDTAHVHPIGHLETSHHDHRTTPVQTRINPHDLGIAHIDRPFREGLLELSGFDHAWFITWLGNDTAESEPVPMHQTPFLLGDTDRTIGVFAIRGPRRPNPVGLHLVEIIAVHADRIEFAGVDMIDKTPLIDIKPYVRALDTPAPTASPPRSGWFDSVALDQPHTPDSIHGRR